MRKVRIGMLSVGLVGLVCSGATHASGFFFFIPGSVVSKVGDALTGAKGEQCVRAEAKVGDVLTSPSGNKATIKSLSGTSSRCQRPELPIRAELEFQYNFSSKAGLELPDGFEPQPVSDFQRYSGMLLRASGPARMGIVVTSRVKQGADLDLVANAVSNEMSKLVDDYKVLSQEHLEINGVQSARFEAEGKNKGVFGPRFNYIVTVLDGASEVVVVNAFAPSKENFSAEREALRKVAYGVRGLVPSAQALATAPVPSTAAAPQAIAPDSLPQAISTPAAVPPQQDASATRSRPVADRLRTLEDLRKQGLVTPQEFEDKRKAILQEL